jgi:hypothetical protein
MSIPATEWPQAEQRIAEVARSRRGQHRDPVLASYRRTRALELRAQGLGYAEIAQAVGYANKGTAHKVIAQALEAREAQDVDLLRHLHLDRLEKLLASAWPRAMQGHLPSVNAVVKIIEQEMRLLGLTESNRKPSPKDGWDNCDGAPTVVARANDCRHQGCERHGKFHEAS